MRDYWRFEEINAADNLGFDRDKDFQMMPETKYRIEALQFESYRTLVIAKTAELAAEADELAKPINIPPCDVTFADFSMLHASLNKLLGRNLCLLFNGLDELCPWFHACCDRITKGLPHISVHLLKPDGQIVEWHKADPPPQVSYEVMENTYDDNVPLPTPDISLLKQRGAPPEFPLQIFGDFWQMWLSDTAKSCGAPVDYVAGALLAAVSALIGNARRVSPYRGWEEPAALWIANVGNPSSGKSPASDPILCIIRDLEIDMAVGFEDTLRDYQTAKESAAVKLDLWRDEVKDAAKKGFAAPLMPEAAMEPDEPIRSRIIANDTSIEKLGYLLSTHEKGLLFHRDELSGWLGGFDRYGGKDGDRAFWIEAYGGRAYQIDRVKHPKPIRIAHMHVALLGGIQPDPLSKLLRSNDDGLAARFLWLWPEPIPPSRPKSSPVNSEIAVKFQRIAKLSMQDNDGVKTPVVMPLSEQANAVFDEWRQEHFEMSKHANGLLASHFGKSPGHLLRLALAIEFLAWAITGGAEPMEIGQKSIASAAHLIDGYFKPMAELLMTDVSIPESERHAATLAKWIVRTKPEVINLRKIRREAGLGGLRDANEMQAAADQLVDTHWLIEIKQKGRHRRRSDYRVNPQLWSAP